MGGIGLTLTQYRPPYMCVLNVVTRTNTINCNVPRLIHVMGGIGLKG